MKIGGVQKSLLNLLNAIENKYDITLLLFNKSGDLIDKIPSSVKVIESKGPFRFFGISQGECKGKLIDYLTRGILVLYTRILGRNRTINLMLKKETKIPDSYDCAISYLHNGRQKAFYGGTQEYVLHCVTADKKIAFLHGDYLKCGDQFGYFCSGRNPWISWTSGALRSGNLSDVVMFSQKCFFCQNPLESEKVSVYNAIYRTRK